MKSKIEELHENDLDRKNACLTIARGLPPSFADLVERFCLDMAAIRSRLANVGRGRDGVGVPRYGPIRGHGARRTPS